MKLGDGLIKLQASYAYRDAYMDTDSGPLNFIGWSPSIRGVGEYSSLFDTFFFNHGSFSGTDSAYWDRISGNADKFFRVSEPSTLALVLISLGG